MEVQEVYVSIKNANEVFDVIREQLSKDMQVQIFIAKKLVKAFWKGNIASVKWFNGSGDFHYFNYKGAYNVKEWYEHRFEDKSVARASFVINSKNFYQLVDFQCRELSLEYKHYIVDLKKLLLINIEDPIS